MKGTSAPRAAAELITHADYVRVVRPRLDPAAFRPSPMHLWRVAFHLVFLLAGYVLIRVLPMVAAPFGTLIAGHSIVCLGFLAHDISHQSVVRNRVAVRLLELLLFGVNVIAPTVWRRVHNQTHHVHSNTLRDSDRPFLERERNWMTTAYVRTLYPAGAGWIRRPAVYCQFIAYISRHTIASLLPGDVKPRVVPCKPRYSTRQRWTIVAELLWIGALQVGIWQLVGGTWARYFWASTGVLVASSIAMTYIFTNHFLNPLCEHPDPLVGSLSVIVPPWMDWLHDNFSYHTEHHLFPAMNPRHFPEVSRLLQEHFPERYNRLPLGDAWRRLWKSDPFIKG